MTDDIVERIDKWAKGDDVEWQDELLRDAKVEIERLRGALEVAMRHDDAAIKSLRAEIERLRAENEGTED